MYIMFLKDTEHWLTEVLYFLKKHVAHATKYNFIVLLNKIFLLIIYYFHQSQTIDMELRFIFFFILCYFYYFPPKGIHNRKGQSSLADHVLKNFWSSDKVWNLCLIFHVKRKWIYQEPFLFVILVTRSVTW